MAKGITEQQKRFCREYLVDHNASAAALRAGYSPNGVHVAASKLLKRKTIKACLKRLTKKVDMDLTITAERVLAEYARIAFQDAGAFFTTDDKGKPRLKTMEELTPDQRAAVSEFDLNAKKLKLYDKQTALQALGKHLKLFTELHELQHTFSIMPTIKRGGRTVEFNVGAPKPAK